MTDSYWVRYKGRNIGPYTLERIRQMVRKAQVGRGHEVSTDGQSWGPATSFPEIFEITAAAEYSVQASYAAPNSVVEQPQASPQSRPNSEGPPPESIIWYCAVGGEQQGPMARSQLIAMLRTGQLSSTDLVFRAGMSDWMPVSETPEMATSLAAPERLNGAAGRGLDAFCRACGAGINSRAQLCPKCGSPTLQEMALAFNGPLVFGQPQPQLRQGDQKSKVVAAVLALCLGGFGAHHFYLNNPLLGVLYVLFCFTLIPAIVAFVEAIIFLSMPDEAFNAKYNT